MSLLDRLRAPGIGKAGRRAERDAVERAGGAATRASGAVGAQGDFTLAGFQVEQKSTKGAAFRATRSLMARCARRALLHGRRPALGIVFTDDAGRSGPGDRWVVIREADFRALVGPRG